MLKLKDLLQVMDDNTVVCICDDMGPLTDVVPIKNLNVKSILYIADRNVERIYFDSADNSITIELEDYEYEEGDNNN